MDEKEAAVVRGILQHIEVDLTKLPRKRLEARLVTTGIFLRSLLSGTHQTCEGSLKKSGEEPTAERGNGPGRSA